MGLGSRVKDPNDVRIYQINWAGFLEANTIVTSDWTVPAGLTSVASANTDTTTQIKLSGGTNGHAYRVYNTIVDSNAETKRVSFIIQIANQ